MKKEDSEAAKIAAEKAAMVFGMITGKEPKAMLVVFDNGKGKMDSAFIFQSPPSVTEWLHECIERFQCTLNNLTENN